MGDTKRVLIVGGGVAGLAAALDLARLGLSTTVVEKTPQLGGHAAQYGCKATETCVKCGACIVVSQVQQALAHPQIEVLTASSVQNVIIDPSFNVTIGASASDLSGAAVQQTVDAVILATGFKPYNPKDKPYGYGLFPNVITNLELEQMIHQQNAPLRPSDNQHPHRIAFIQCVGSRDAKLGHLWCSKICCASALRLARLIRMRRPETEITFYYIDVQTFGTAFQAFYKAVSSEINLQRVIPGDIYPTGDDCLKITSYHLETQQSLEEIFDMVVLSIAITPAADHRQMAEHFGVTLADTGFIKHNAIDVNSTPGIFTAGTVCGPMSIAEAVVSGSQAAQHVATYLTYK